MLIMMLLTVVGLTAAGYAHLQIPRLVATRPGVVVSRAVLIVVGLGFGYVAAATYADRSLAVLAFFAGFGAVHVPAALILLLKRAGGSRKS